MKVWLFMRIGYPRRITGSYLLAGKDYDRVLGPARNKQSQLRRRPQKPNRGFFKYHRTLLTLHWTD